MSTPAPAPEAAPPRRRVKKRLYIPAILLGLIALLAIGGYVRGTWADTVEKNPSGAEDGTRTQLLQKQNGNVVVRCAIVVDAPPRDTWAVVSDYGSHHHFVPYITHLEEKKQKDGKLLIEGIAHSRVYGDFPFETLVTQTQDAGEGEYTATWNHENKGLFKINRGGWKLRPFDKDKKQTLLEFQLQIEFEHYPNFFVRNVVMDRLHSILKAMRDETLRRQKA